MNTAHEGIFRRFQLYHLVTLLDFLVEELLAVQHNCDFSWKRRVLCYFFMKSVSPRTNYSAHRCPSYKTRLLGVRPGVEKSWIRHWSTYLLRVPNSLRCHYSRLDFHHSIAYKFHVLSMFAIVSFCLYQVNGVHFRKSAFQQRKDYIMRSHFSLCTGEKRKVSRLTSQLHPDHETWN